MKKLLLLICFLQCTHSFSQDLATLIECLQKGLPLDQNLYEGCFWSSVTELSGKSVAQEGAPQKFPDFTRGNWKNTKPLKIIS